MTLIVGILCEGGIVLAADSQATLGSPAGMTAAVRTARKLTIVHEKAVIGVSGPVGLGQRLTALIEEKTKNHFHHDPMKIVGQLRSEMWSLVKPEIEASQVVARATNNANFLQNALCTTLVAMPTGDGAKLIQFAADCSPEFATPELPCVSIGSGQRSADPFLSFLRRTLWPNSGLPTVADGLLLAHLTVRHVVDVDPSGVGGDSQLVSLAQVNGDWVAREHDQAEREQHEAAAKDLERVIAEWRASFKLGATAAAVKAPPE